MKLKIKKEWIILIVALVILAAGLGIGFFLHSNRENMKIDTPKDPEIKEEYINHLPEAREQYNNDDIVAEIEMPNLEMKELVVRSTDNKYYLNRDIEKKYTVKGTIYMDYRNLDLDNDREVNIFGHNSDPTKRPYYPDLPFAKLLNYLEEDYFNDENNQEIIYRTDNGEYKYKIFMVSKIEKSDNEHMKINYKGKEYLNHINRLRSKAVFDTGVEITEDDKILELQTCLFRPEQLLLLIAKRVA